MTVTTVVTVEPLPEVGGVLLVVVVVVVVDPEADVVDPLDFDAVLELLAVVGAVEVDVVVLELGVVEVAAVDELPTLETSSPHAASTNVQIASAESVGTWKMIVRVRMGRY